MDVDTLMLSYNIIIDCNACGQINIIGKYRGRYGISPSWLQPPNGCHSINYPIFCRLLIKLHTKKKRKTFLGYVDYYFYS